MARTYNLLSYRRGEENTARAIRQSQNFQILLKKASTQRKQLRMTTKQLSSKLTQLAANRLSRGQARPTQAKYRRIQQLTASTAASSKIQEDT